MHIFSSIITVLFFITIGVKSLMGFDVNNPKAPFYYDLGLKEMIQKYDEI